MGFLFGDILAVSVTDIAVIYVGGAVVLAVLVAACGGRCWRRTVETPKWRKPRGCAPR